MNRLTFLRRNKGKLLLLTIVTFVWIFSDNWGHLAGAVAVVGWAILTAAMLAPDWARAALMERD